MDKPEWSGGAQTGYNLGQNGAGWPQLWKDPLANDNRGGFYIRQLRVKGVFPFDSTFTGVFIGNIIFLDVQEAYLQKRWDTYLLKVGKFRGAGLKTGPGTDDFEMTTVRPTFYAAIWGANKRLQNFRDFGIQAERSFFEGRLNGKLFFHNANGENVFTGEPSFFGGPNTQALGLDYEMDYQLSPYTVMGGHVGALADRQWSEFTGSHGGWNVPYWFKSNPIVDFSAFHQMDFARLHFLNEAMLLYNRRILVPADSGSADSVSLQTWGVSSMLRYDASARWSPFFRYEFTVPDNVNTVAYHLITLGTAFHPSPSAYPNLKFTGEYVRTLEQGFTNLVSNDVLYVQLQTLF